MKIAIASRGPEATSEIDPHFGRARFFHVIDSDTGQRTVVDNEAGVNAAHGAGTRAVQTLIDAGVQAVIAARFGPKAWTALRVANVPAYAVSGGTVAEAAKAFAEGKLAVVDNAV